MEIDPLDLIFGKMGLGIPLLYIKKFGAAKRKRIHETAKNI